MLTTTIEDGPRGPSSKHSLGLQRRADRKKYSLRILKQFRLKLPISSQRLCG